MKTKSKLLITLLAAFGLVGLMVSPASMAAYYWHYHWAWHTGGGYHHYVWHHHYYHHYVHRHWAPLR